MLKRVTVAVAALVLTCCCTAAMAAGGSGKPSPDEVVKILAEGNARFVAGTPEHEHCDAARLAQAGSEDQGDHAIATIITCSDSRVPVELLFDQGVMDVFVIRVAGNVVGTDEAGSIEYGLAHVHTPVLVVLGHTQCGAVTAVTNAALGHGHALERNIPPLVAPIRPAVARAMEAHPGAETAEVVPAAIKENVWQGIEDLFLASPSTRELVRSGKVKVVGAIYDVGSGTVAWLPGDKVGDLLAQAEADPSRAVNAMYAAPAARGASAESAEAGEGHAAATEAPDVAEREDGAAERAAVARQPEAETVGAATEDHAADIQAAPEAAAPEEAVPAATGEASGNGADLAAFLALVFVVGAVLLLVRLRRKGYL